MSGPKMINIQVGTPIYHAHRNFLGRLEIEKLFIIEVKGDGWVYNDYDNHLRAFRCNHRSHKEVQLIYSETPEQAVEKFKESLWQEFEDSHERAQELLAEANDIAGLAESVTINDFKMVERKYDPLDDLL